MARERGGAALVVPDGSKVCRAATACMAPDVWRPLMSLIPKIQATPTLKDKIKFALSAVGMSYYNPQNNYYRDPHATALDPVTGQPIPPGTTAPFPVSPPKVKANTWTKILKCICYAMAEIQEAPKPMREVQHVTVVGGNGQQNAEDSNQSAATANKESPIHLTAWIHIFKAPLSFRWTFVHYYKQPGWVYEDQTIYRHRDFAGRVARKPKSDRYLHHQDGHLRNLIVQCTDDIFEAPHNATWQRTYIRKVSPLKSRIATWVVDFTHDPDGWDDWGIMVLRALPAAFAMTFMFLSFTTGRIENQGYYAPVPYAFHGDAKVWGNLLENVNNQGLRPALATNNHVYRLLKPRHLCFLVNPYDDEMHGMRVRAISEWEHEAAARGKPNLDYLFVAWSTRQFNIKSPEDMAALMRLAERACRDAKLPAFWISSRCMVDPNELESDVYRISDILRGAQKMVIVVGPPSQPSHTTPPTAPSTTDTDELLKHWGSRLWTFPEILLSPGNSVAVYNRASDTSPSPLVITKNQFAARVWADTDATISGQLLDHYAGTLELSRLELAVTLLKCLFARHTQTWLPGDHSYALMGLLHLRPKIDATDSAFQAFARISLSNDSDQLLERAISILPANGATQPWHDFTDAYGSQLWDISPSCQVAGICANDTVIIDGARGASIRWKSFYHVASSTRLSWKRFFALLLLEYQFIFLIIATTTFALGVYPVGILFLLVWIYVWLMTPNLVRLCLGGKLVDVQAALFGFEGYLNAPTVERAIFGGNFNRLGWSVNGSPLSRSYINEHGERVAVDPTRDVAVREKVERAKRVTGPGQTRIFTLVDTYNMQMTLFEAERPPVCVFLCGAEGGMQRAVACSYDFTTGTFHRETVLRMPTTSLNRMDRASRFRLGMRRPEELFRARLKGDTAAVV
ncbi:hypothetical protein VTJ49DRAFT_35 [Mycothermus thermophilus]|uniref:3-hydroxyisobutyrate dehydrogenase protein n=1 Tax=Humicola insolens TaxID=85995 RepID=A0ABR3VRR7_HUMIN